jgi:hypothetical protein
MKRGKPMSVHRRTLMHAMVNTRSQHSHHKSCSIPESRDIYKKSVANSLVYRSLKMEREGYVGFKVTFSGKGGKHITDRSRRSVILIPDIALARSYRPIAGAIARSTRGEVFTCGYSSAGTCDYNLISVFAQRVSNPRSKIRRIDVISQNHEILKVFKDRLSAVSATSTDLHPVYPSVELCDTGTVQVTSGTNRSYHERHVNLIRLDATPSLQSKSHPKLKMASIFKSVIAKLSSIFGNPNKNQRIKPESESSIFRFSEWSYSINEHLSFDNPFHCDIIAQELLAIHCRK